MDRLEDAIRQAESPADLILLLRGGEDTEEKLLRQAALLGSRYTYSDKAARGISCFAAHGDLDAREILDTKLRTYPQYCRVEAAALFDLGLLLDNPKYEPKRMRRKR